MLCHSRNKSLSRHRWFWAAGVGGLLLVLAGCDFNTQIQSTVLDSLGTLFKNLIDIYINNLKGDQTTPTNTVWLTNVLGPWLA